MRSVESRGGVLAALLAAASLAGCASVADAVKKPVEAVQQAISAAPAAPAASTPSASAPARAVASAVPAQAPVGADTQRAFEAAKASLRAGRTADAERAFRDLSARHPELGGAHANLGLILRNAGKHDESVAAMEKAVKASPSQAVFHNQLGLSLRHAGKFAKAREAYEAALALDPGYADAHLNLGVLLDLYLAEPALALVHYERYLALVPGGDAGRRQVGGRPQDTQDRQRCAGPMRRTRRGAMTMKRLIPIVLAAASLQASAQDRADIDRTQIIGNRELPKVLYIVPWKKPLPGDPGRTTIGTACSTRLSHPVDRDVSSAARSTTARQVAGQKCQHGWQATHSIQHVITPQPRPLPAGPFAEALPTIAEPCRSHPPHEHLHRPSRSSSSWTAAWPSTPAS
jgi:tetratricopeptide (TPR) repeat protein